MEICSGVHGTAAMLITGRIATSDARLPDMDEHGFELILDRSNAFEFLVTFDEAGLPQLAMDEPPPLGSGKGPNAARLLGAAIGHCLSASLLFCLQKSRIDVHGMETKVTGSVVRNEQGRLRIDGIRVTLAPKVPEDKRDRMTRCLEIFEDFCIVTGSVRSGIEVAVDVAPQTATV